MAGITVLKSNIPHGPFTRAEIAQKLASGEITPDSLAFVEGLSQWTPLRDVLVKVDGMPSPHAPIGTGFSIEQKAPATVAAPIGAGYSYAATMAPPSHFVYAGFWLRFVAIFIDGIVTLPLAIPYYGFYFGMTFSKDENLHPGLLIGVVLSWFVLFIGRWLYFSLMESGSWQATVGKRVMGLYVTDRQGQRIGFGRATGRYFGKIISGLPLCVGFMMAGWTERKQALHDLVADTLVVRKPGS